MKKKITLVATSVLLVAAMVIGGTLAYFTDTENADNTFTVGNVDITLIEQQRGANDAGEPDLVDFVQGKELAPIVGSAQGEKDDFDLPVAENYVDKIVTVKNTGSKEAWVRAYFAIPSALDDGPDTYNAMLNVLHFNYGTTGNNVTTFDKEWKWKSEDSSKLNCFVATIDGISYNVYYADYYKPLAAGATTERLIGGLYLDNTFNFVDGKAVAFGQELKLDKGWNWKNVQCPVFAVAIQTDGFDSVSAAVNGAFGANFNPWAAE